MLRKLTLLVMGVVMMTSNTSFAASEIVAMSRDEAQIRSNLSSFAVLADQGAFEYLGALFAPSLTLDYRSLFGGEIQQVEREALMQQWVAFLPGFDATYHQLSNLQVSVAGEQASATVDVVARHWLGEQGYWAIAGSYQFSLSKLEGQWLIDAVTLLASQESGSRDILASAPEQAPANYRARQQRRLDLD